MRRLILWLIVGLLLAGGAGAVWNWGIRERAELPSEFREGVRRADRAVLYEGLPHHNYEPELLKKEWGEKRTIDLGGFPFYERPLDWKGDTADRLAALVTDPLRLKDMGTAEKKCGGFHPDYAVVWEGDGGRALALVCLGCGDVLLIGPADSKGKKYAVSKSDMRNWFYGYREQRPPFRLLADERQW